MCGFGALFVDDREAVFGEFPVDFIERVDHARHVEDQRAVDGSELATFGECGINLLTAGT